jgi:hypothetical protein
MGGEGEEARKEGMEGEKEDRGGEREEGREEGSRERRERREGAKGGSEGRERREGAKGGSKGGARGDLEGTDLRRERGGRLRHRAGVDAAQRL